jgi:hypothetical protein
VGRDAFHETCTAESSYYKPCAMLTKARVGLATCRLLVRQGRLRKKFGVPGSIKGRDPRFCVPSPPFSLRQFRFPSNIAKPDTHRPNHGCPFGNSAHRSADRPAGSGSHDGSDAPTKRSLVLPNAFRRALVLGLPIGSWNTLKCGIPHANTTAAGVYAALQPAIALAFKEFLRVSWEPPKSI